MTLEAYRETKHGGGKLKMRALVRLAQGGDDARFEAATLLREAARAEERALRLLESPAPRVRLGVAVERCACLVDALAPTAAAGAWGEVLIEGDGLADDVVRAERTKLDPQYEALQRAHQKALAGAPTLRAAGFFVPAVTDMARARREPARLLRLFPGEVKLWYTRYQAAFCAKDMPGRGPLWARCALWSRRTRSDSRGTDLGASAGLGSALAPHRSSTALQAPDGRRHAAARLPRRGESRDPGLALASLATPIACIHQMSDNCLRQYTCARRSSMRPRRRRMSGSPASLRAPTDPHWHEQPCFACRQLPQAHHER